MKKKPRVRKPPKSDPLVLAINCLTGALYNLAGKLK